jgi:hypothetical protein
MPALLERMGSKQNVRFGPADGSQILVNKERFHWAAGEKPFGWLGFCSLLAASSLIVRQS